MAENKVKTTTPTAAEPAAAPAKKNKQKRPSLFGNFNVGAFVIFDNIYFIFYLGFLGIVYIANSHYALKTVKEIRIIQAQLQKISWESNWRKSELMLESMENRVKPKVLHLGLTSLDENPKKIILKD
jgi:hypothetical protein